MKKLFLISTFLILTISAYAAPDLPLEMSFQEYQEYYKSFSSIKSDEPTDNNVKQSITGGQKMNAWLGKINANRSDDNKVRLTSKSYQRGIPVDKPSKYGPSTIEKRLNDLKKNMPKNLFSIIYGLKEILNHPNGSDEDFIKWARKSSDLYQTAVRWSGSQRWLSHYEKRRVKDVRGYYYLKDLKDLDYQLKNFKTLSIEQQEKLKEALFGICLNDIKRDKRCRKNIINAAKKNTLTSFKKRYWAAAVANWHTFWRISNPRNDVKWPSSNLSEMRITFKDPKNALIANWLRDNIEDEFKFAPENWNLKMDFVSSGLGTAYLEFKANVTPHVSGGNKVVMDKNTDIEEYSVKWTIRHEYGHILRLPDCYFEFYDKTRKLMINYQLDVSDLMCSRAGFMNERIYKELKRVYFK